MLLCVPGVPCVSPETFQFLRSSAVHSGRAVGINGGQQHRRPLRLLFLR